MILNFIQDIEYCGNIPRIPKDPACYNYKFEEIYLEKDNEILVLKLSFNKSDIHSSLQEYIKLFDSYKLNVFDEKSVKEIYNIDASIFPCISRTKKYGHIKKLYLVPQITTEIFRKLINLYNNNDNPITYEDFCLLTYFYNLSIIEKNIKVEHSLKKLFSSVNIKIIDRLDKVNLENMINSNNINQEDNYEKINFILKLAKDNKEKFKQIGLDFKAVEINNDEKQKHI